jgi:hypothetical protein
VGPLAFVGCRFCAARFGNWLALRGHVQERHGPQFNQIYHWIRTTSGDVDEGPLGGTDEQEEVPADHLDDDTHVDADSDADTRAA